MTELEKMRAEGVLQSLKACADLSHGCAGCHFITGGATWRGLPCVDHLARAAQYILEDLTEPGAAPISDGVRTCARQTAEELQKLRAMGRRQGEYAGSVSALFDTAARWIGNILEISEKREA